MEENEEKKCDFSFLFFLNFTKWINKVGYCLSRWTEPTGYRQNTWTWHRSMTIEETGVWRDNWQVQRKHENDIINLMRIRRATSEYAGPEPKEMNFMGREFQFCYLFSSRHKTAWQPTPLLVHILHFIIIIIFVCVIIPLETAAAAAAVVTTIYADQVCE